MKKLILMLTITTITNFVFADTLIAQFIQNKSGDRDILQMYESEDGNNLFFKLCNLDTHVFAQDEINCQRFGSKKGYPISLFEDYLRDIKEEISKVEISNNCFNPTQEEYASIAQNYHLILKKVVVQNILFPEHFEVKISGGSITTCDSYRELGFDRFKNILRSIILENN